MLTRRGFLKAAVAAPAIILTPGLLMPVRKIITPLFTGELGSWSNVKLHPMQWSLDGLQWTDDEMALFEKNPLPAYVFNRYWVSVSNFDGSQPACVIRKAMAE